MLKIAHERNDKAERLAKHEYFKEKEQRERYENALFRQERVSYEELRAVAMLDAEFEVHAHKVAMIALFFWQFGDHGLGITSVIHERQGYGTCAW